MEKPVGGFWEKKIYRRYTYKSMFYQVLLTKLSSFAENYGKILEVGTFFGQIYVKSYRNFPTNRILADFIQICENFDNCVFTNVNFPTRICSLHRFRMLYEIFCFETYPQ